MSHAATNWAIQQRGLKPATKLVLWHLADRHNPDLGCFPAQARLAADCEMSRASINTHLKILEAKGLIRRERRVNTETRRQQATRYFLACEDDFHAEKPCPDSGLGSVSRKAAKPCPENAKSRVQNLDTNLVREPIRKPACAREADRRPFDRFCEVFPKLRDRNACEVLFDDAVAAGANPEVIVAAARRYRAENGGKAKRYLCASDRWLQDKRWQQGRRAAPGASGSASLEDRAAWWASKVHAGDFIPPSALNNTMIAEMLGRQLVTSQQLRAIGF
ncbi:MAG: hypothetical protein CL868_13055 [Cytophagaceae bacterium]|nr:hypothetical protein [Cytophagaceae bacterium]